MFNYDRLRHESSGRTETAIRATCFALGLGIEDGELVEALVTKGFTSEETYFIIVAAKMLFNVKD